MQHKEYNEIGYRKNRDLRVNYLVTLLILAFLISSCLTETWDFIGTWDQQPDKLTYINPDQRIKLTFPNEKWRVYTKPDEKLKRIWKNPWREASSYHVLWAFVGDWPHAELMMGLQIEPFRGHRLGIEMVNVTLDEYLALFKSKMESGSHEIDYKVIQRKDRRMGVLTIKSEGDMRFCILFKEKDRFSELVFICAESLFESYKNQFWAIADSYEYLE